MTQIERIDADEEWRYDNLIDLIYLIMILSQISRIAQMILISGQRVSGLVG